MDCGTPVEAPSTREVRKTVTLLFTDVTGSTAMGEQLDPEAYRGVMGRYFEVARQAVERHGGTVEKFVGDAVLAVFGVPEVREDDALRAVRAAYELNVAIQALSEELDSSLGIRLEVRTGVNTGSVVTGAARAGGSFATGDAVNAAARLEQAAAPGTVLIGAETHDLVRDAVEVQAVEPISAKGKAEPLVAYQLLDVHEASTGRTRRTDLKLVGRDRETRALDDALERTLESGRGHLVTVLGPAGIGKSRLVSDFLDRVGDRAEVVSGRCVSYGHGITYWPVVQLLRQALDLSGGESDEITRYTLEQLLGGSPDRASVAELLLPILGKSGEPGGSEQTFWAVRRALEELATRRPLVVTVDDLHWAEPTLLELIERVRDEVRDLPLLLVCQARPELLEEHPGWGGGSLNSLTFGLEPFTADQTRVSLTELLGGEVPREVSETVTAWAGGNPLFIEEIATHLVDSGLLQRTPDGWALTGDLASAQVPPTVAALLAARLDRLPDGERSLVERISVVGLELSTEEAVFLAAGTIPSDEVPATLAALARRDLLHRRRTDQGETWAFRHLMVRDAAYTSLPKALRAELHERFADRVEASGDQTGAERTAFVAHHLEQALAYRRELARHDPTLGALATRAATTLMGAALDARDREDMAAAVRLLQRGLALDLPETRLRRRLLVSLVQVHSNQEQVTDMVATVQLLADAMDDTATELEQTGLDSLRGLAAISASVPVDPEQVAVTAVRCAELARASGDDQLLVMALTASADRHMMSGRWEQVADDVVELKKVGRAFDKRWAHLFESAVILYGLAPMSDLVGQVAEQRARGGLTPGEEDRLQLTGLIARAAADEPGVGLAIQETEDDLDPGLRHIYRHLLLGVAYQLSGDLTGAIRCFEETIRVMLAAGDSSHASTQLAWTALFKLERGDPVDEAQVMVQDADTHTSPYDVMSLAMVAAGRGLIAARHGDHATATNHLDEAIQLVDTSDQVWHQAELRRLAGFAAELAGNHDDARRLLTDARDRYASKEIVTWTRWCDERLEQLNAPR